VPPPRGARAGLVRPAWATRLGGGTHRRGELGEQPAHAELEALAHAALDRVRRRWDSEHASISPTLLDGWLAVAARLPEHPALPDLTATWIELLPTPPLYLASPAELDQIDDWLRLVEVLGEHAPEELEALGFPEQHGVVVSELIEDAYALLDRDNPLEVRELLAQVLRRLARVVPAHAGAARELASAIAVPERASFARAEAPIVPRLPPPERALVDRILRDLRA
jgi:hypothetical protein